MLMKNSNDTIGNRTCDLPASWAIPQPNAPSRAPIFDSSCSIFKQVLLHYKETLWGTFQNGKKKHSMFLELNKLGRK